MKTAVVCLLFIAVAAVSAAEKYTTKYDNVNVDDILKNKRLLKGYTNCLLGKTTCSPDGAELKRILPDAIATDCNKCSEQQRNGSKKILRHLVDKETAIWTQLEKKYDPTGAYKIKYREQAKREGIRV